MATGWGRRIRVEQQKVVVNQTPTAQTTWFASLSTANPADDASANAEPTAANGYAAQAITWNTLTAFGSLTVDTASQATNSALITFGPSTAAFSTGATALAWIGLWTNVSTRTESVYLGRAQVAGGGFAVNAAGISLTLAANTGIVMGLISA